MKRKARKFLFVSMTLLTSSVFSQEISFVQEETENDFSCYIDRYEGEKVYLKPEYINITEEGIYLYPNKAVLIPVLYSDPTGCFVEGDVWCRLCQIKHEPPPCIPSYN